MTRHAGTQVSGAILRLGLSVPPLDFERLHGTAYRIKVIVNRNTD